MGENELGQGLAHMMAAPANRSGQGMLDNSIIAERDSLRAEVERLNADYLNACKLVADMHAAAMGEMRGPKRGVVEDVADLRAAYERLRKGRDDGQRSMVARAGDGDASWLDARLPRMPMVVGNSLDPRLGTPQPEGEPVGTRPMRRWVPIL